MDPEARVKYLPIQPLLATAWLLATRASSIYLVDEFICLLLLLLKEMGLLCEPKVLSFFVSGVNQGNVEVEWLQDFLL